MTLDHRISALALTAVLAAAMPSAMAVAQIVIAQGPPAAAQQDPGSEEQKRKDEQKRRGEQPPPRQGAGQGGARSEPPGRGPEQRRAQDGPGAGPGGAPRGEPPGRGPEQRRAQDGPGAGPGGAQRGEPPGRGPEQRRAQDGRGEGPGGAQKGEPPGRGPDQRRNAEPDQGRPAPGADPRRRQAEPSERAPQSGQPPAPPAKRADPPVPPVKRADPPAPPADGPGSLPGARQLPPPKSVDQQAPPQRGQPPAPGVAGQQPPPPPAKGDPADRRFGQPRPGPQAPNQQPQAPGQPPDNRQQQAAPPLPGPEGPRPGVPAPPRSGDPRFGGNQPPPPAPGEAGQDRAYQPPPGFRPSREAGAPPPASLQQVQRQRQERRDEGGRTIIQEPGRTIIRENNTVIIRHDEGERLRRFAPDVRQERRPDGVTVNVFSRPGGVQVVTEVDAVGRPLRRFRREPGGREVVLFENRPRRPGVGTAVGIGIGLGVGAAMVALAPPVIRIPRERYIVEYDRASEDDVYEALSAPPVEDLERRYTLEEIRYSQSLRERVRRVDLDTINFEFGAWDIGQDQYRKLERIARAMLRVIERDPSEMFLIEGHTDAVGQDVDNLSLSDRRAESVAAILTEQFQVPPENLVTQGYGEQFLKVQTQAPEAQNRRVAVRRITPMLARE